MKIGLLECDHVADKFVDISGTYPDMFAALLPDVEFQLYDVCNGEFPESIDECDAYTTTGSRFSVYDKLDWISQLKDFIYQLHQKEKKFVGVCFGHQMMAEALGGKVLKSEKGWNVGVHSFEIVSKESWMDPFQQNLNLLMMCQDQIVRMPENSKILASSANCPVGIFKVGENMLGIQAHPEFSKDYEKAFMLSRTDRIGEEKIQKALDSLEKAPDKSLIRDWIMNFLKDKKKSNF